MHYGNGRAAKNGDKVAWISPYSGTVVVGVLFDAVAGNDYCNGRLAVIESQTPCPNLKECLHLDDFKALVPTVLAEVPDTSAQSDSP